MNNLILRTVFKSFFPTVLISLFLPVSALSKDVDTEISDPIGDGGVNVTVIVGGVRVSINVPIEASLNKQQKITRIVDFINDDNRLTAVATTDAVRIKDLADSARVIFTDVATGQDFNRLASTFLDSGSLGYASLFETGSSVTGGFFTDLGEVSENLILENETSGEDLTTTFFNLFTDNIGDFNAIGITDISFIEDEIIAEYDPLVTSVRAGVIFGSTSTNGTVIADIAGVSVPEPTSTLPFLALGLLGATSTLKKLHL